MPEIKSLCVIGGSGFVGSHIINLALTKGWKVNATIRDSSDKNKTDWMMTLPNAKCNLKLFDGDLNKKGSFSEAIKGCDGVVVCALPESPSNPELLETVVGGVKHILQSCTDHGVKSVVVTSSGGSTNPKDGEPPIKNEIDHWSDPDFQISQGKYSPAAKTLVDKECLKYAEQHPELKVAVLNPNLIMGPMFHKELPEKSSLNMLSKIIKKERLDKVPNGSMSIIDVRDLAELELAALEKDDARGRYFGVLRSFHWKEIFAALHEVYDKYEVPPQGYEGKDARPTQFDHTRKDSLGITLRDLKTVLKDAVADLQRRNMID